MHALISLRFVVMLAVFAVVVPLGDTLRAQTDRRCFDVPGITNCIEGRFRQYWEQNGGLAVFGYPLTPAANRASAEGTFLTQDFERNRFELHPENAAPYDVLLGRLGDDLLRAQGLNWQSFTRSAGREDCRYFAETQHNLCDFGDGIGFRTYWETHGLQDPRLDGYGRSLALFGLPLSEPGFETNAEGDTVVTQWFERARFEWHPDNPDAFKVLLGRLSSEAARPAQPRGLTADIPWLSTADRIVGAAPHTPVLPMPKGDALVHLVVSRDGSRLLQQQQHVIGQGGFGLFLIEPRTGERANVLDTFNGAIAPMFSPDGTTVAFTTVDETTWSFQTLNLATKVTRVVTSGPTTDRVVWPIGWTDRGVLVAKAIWGSDAPLTELGMIDMASGAIRPLYTGTFWSAVPSEDGSRVALMAGTFNLGGTPALTVIALDVRSGRTTTVGDTVSAAISRMAWSPDASRLLYIATNYESGDSTLHVVGANGDGHSWLTFKPLDGLRTLQDAGWRSNTTLLVVNARERALAIYDLPANDLRPERLQSRASITEKIHGAQNVRLIYLPR